MKHDSIPPITSRIYLLLEHKNMSQSELARALGIRQSTISGWRQKFNEPEAELLEPISKALNVSIEWLITGTESNTIESSTFPEDKQQLLEYYDQCNLEGKNRILEQAEFIATKYPQQGKSSEYKIG